MTTSAIMNHTLTNSKLNDNDYLNTLIKENEQLKISNNKLYQKTLNLKRKNIRFKKMLTANNSTEHKETLNTDLDNTKPKNEDESVITDVIWEDVNDLIKSYENEDTHKK